MSGPPQCRARLETQSCRQQPKGENLRQYHHQNAEEHHVCEDSAQRGNAFGELRIVPLELYERTQKIMEDGTTMRHNLARTSLGEMIKELRSKLAALAQELEQVKEKAADLKNSAVAV